MVRWDSAAETQTAAERLRLPHAHLRQPFSRCAQRHNAATRCERRRPPPPSERIGTARIVVVAPSTYGTDNSCTLDAMAQFGPAARGVAVVDTSVTDAELKRLNDLGVRGIRFNLVQSGTTTIDMLEPLSRRVNDFGWHVRCTC